MDPTRVLIIDDDAETIALLVSSFAGAGVDTEVVDDAFAAIEKLRHEPYAAVVLDPMIRHRLNGYVVLNFIELEQPETLARLFLLTGMSEQTIRRTAPSILSRLFRKPLATRAAAAAVIAACEPRLVSSTQQPARRSVLLVEDDEATAAATRLLLEEMGYSVEHLRSGQELLESVCKRDFDVIVLDLVMPEVDGFTVLEHFHSTKPRLLRRVIVTTGMPEKYLQALDQTAIGGFVRKPLDAAQLEDLLRRVSDRWTPFEAGGETPAVC